MTNFMFYSTLRLCEMEETLVQFCLANVFLNSERRSVRDFVWKTRLEDPICNILFVELIF
jgi:hypothetical protein